MRYRPQGRRAGGRGGRRRCMHLHGVGHARAAPTSPTGTLALEVGDHLAPMPASRLVTPAARFKAPLDDGIHPCGHVGCGWVGCPSGAASRVCIAWPTQTARPPGTPARPRQATSPAGSRHVPAHARAHPGSPQGRQSLTLGQLCCLRAPWPWLPLQHKLLTCHYNVPTRVVSRCNHVDLRAFVYRCRVLSTKRSAARELQSCLGTLPVVPRACKPRLHPRWVIVLGGSRQWQAGAAVPAAESRHQLGRDARCCLFTRTGHVRASAGGHHGAGAAPWGTCTLMPPAREGEKR